MSNPRPSPSRRPIGFGRSSHSSSSSSPSAFDGASLTTRMALMKATVQGFGMGWFVVCAVVANLAVFGAGLYVIAHFVAKFW